MKISLGAAGQWVVGVGLTFLATGGLAGLPVISALGAASLSTLIWASAVARLVGADVARGALRARIGEGAAEARARVGRPITLPVRLAGGAIARIAGITLEPVVVAPARATIAATDAGFDLTFQSPQVGHAWLQGFRFRADIAGGLLAVRGWLPCAVTVSILPRAFPLRGDPPLRATRAASQDRAELGRARRRGFGLEIRELRDHQPGDAFKHIAWAATARRGKLVTREFESDLVLSAWLLVDVSPSMFWGEPGQTRADFAIETAYNLASQLLARGDRVGVSLFDERVRLDIPPSAARGQLFRVLEALQEVHHLFHDNRTEVTERELVRAVAGWFETHQNRSFRLPESLTGRAGPRQSEHDELHLQEAVDTWLKETASRRRPARFPLPVDAYSRDRRRSAWRAFCRHAGIALPLDPTPRPGGQAHGLEQAVEHVLRARGGPHTLCAISDLSTADDLDALRRAAMGARRHRHGFLVLCPSDPAFEGAARPEDGPLAEALLEVQRIRTRHGLAAVEAALKPAGVALLTCTPRDVLPRLLKRLDQVA
ncbi:MAG: DUF58 domain-containing protein [Myxococcota bacterium]